MGVPKITNGIKHDFPFSYRRGSRISGKGVQIQFVFLVLPIFFPKIRHGNEII